MKTASCADLPNVRPRLLNRAQLGGDPRGILLALFLLMGEVIAAAENY
jgi:hypothetical protein